MGTSDDGQIRAAWFVFLMEHAGSCPLAVMFQSSGLRRSSHRFGSEAAAWRFGFMEFRV